MNKQQFRRLREQHRIYAGGCKFIYINPGTKKPITRTEAMVLIRRIP